MYYWCLEVSALSHMPALSVESELLILWSHKICDPLWLPEQARFQSLGEIGATRWWQHPPPYQSGFCKVFLQGNLCHQRDFGFFCYCWIIEDCICIWCLWKSSCGWSGSMTGQWSICYCQTANVMRKYWHENYCGCLSVFGPMLWQRLRSQPQEVHVVLSCSQQIQWSYSIWW